MKFCKTCVESGDGKLCETCSRGVRDALNLCDQCGSVLAVGQWPWCPHGEARNFGEAPLEPYWDENITPEGAHITTRAERRRIMYANKQEYKDLSSKRRGRFYIDMGRR